MPVLCGYLALSAVRIGSAAGYSVFVPGRTEV